MGTYATVEDLRDEGVTPDQASDTRLEVLLEEASRAIDRLTGWWFEPRRTTLRLDGRGTPTVEPPVPPIRVQRLEVEGKLVSRAADDLLVVGAPVEPMFDSPRLTLLTGAVFPEGQANVKVTGWWGYTEDDGTTYGRTPLSIRRACMLLVLRGLPLLGDTEAVVDAISWWRITEERTRDQSYKLDRVRETAPLTGDPEVDRILLRYRRPAGLGAA